MSTIESPVQENHQGGSTVEMETCGVEPRVNVGNQGADDMDVLDTRTTQEYERGTCSYTRVSEYSSARDDRLLG